MNILITGGAGFIGTHLTRQLLRCGHVVSIMDNFLPQVHGDARDLAADLRADVRLIEGDVADPSAFRSALDDAQCVVHLAAETGTGQSMYEVARYGRANLTGTTLLYDLLIHDAGKKLERLVVASSRAIYGEGAYECLLHGTVYPQSRPVTDKESGVFDPVCSACGGACSTIPTPESAPFQPSSFYGLTKQVQEQMTLMFGQLLGVPSVALRYQNVFGPGQSLQNPYTGILAIFSNLARSGCSIQIFEDGQESRDFVYIDDVVDATTRAITEPLTGCHSVNVGSGRRTTVLDVANAINQHYGNASEVKVTGAFREGDIRHGAADLTRAEAILGFRPRWTFREGLDKFLAWVDESDPAESKYERSLTEMKLRGLFRG